jgi:hypothetical protein
MIQVVLLLFVGGKGRLPCRSLSAGRGGNCLDLLFFWLLQLTIASLLTFGHSDLLGFDEAWELNADPANVVITRIGPVRAGEVRPNHIWI